MQPAQPASGTDTNFNNVLTAAGNTLQQGTTAFTDAAQNALDYYANLTVQGQNEGGAAGLAKQTLGTIGGLLSSLATQDNLGQTAAILALPVALEAGAGTQIGRALLSNPVIAESLNILGGIASASDLSQAISGVNAEGRQLSPAEQLAKATSGLGGGVLTAGSAAPKVAEILDNLAPKLKQLGSQGTAALDAASSKLNQLLNGDAQLATAGPDSNVLKAEVQKTEGNQGPLQSRKLESGGDPTVSNLGSTENSSNDLALTRLKTPEGNPIPYGFKSPDEYQSFTQSLKDKLPEGVDALFQGSSVTGENSRTGKLFDVGRTSDFDIALTNDKLFQQAKGLGYKAKDGTRIGPLTDAQLDKLGLLDAAVQLRGEAGRPVGFMLFDSLNSAYTRPSIPAF